MFELLRARLRNLAEGLVQTLRAESSEHQAHDGAERFQDYGFTGAPAEGQGMVIHWGGHTIVLRMDSLKDRPQLAPWEVAVWHREGHSIKLKGGKVVDVDCDTFNLTATTINLKGATHITGPLAATGRASFGGGALTHEGKNIGASHTHTGVQAGPANTGAPQ